jgi:hypothetical protein
MYYRLGLGLFLVGLTVAAHAAQPEQDLFAPHLDLLKILPVHLDTDGLPRLAHYRFSASVVLTHAADVGPPTYGSNSPVLANSAIELQQEAVWARSSSWQLISSGDRPSLSPLLRIESKDEKLEVTPRRHSVRIEWRKNFP